VGTSISAGSAAPKCATVPGRFRAPANQPSCWL
jgi:hypothetical protein